MVESYPVLLFFAGDIGSLFCCAVPVGVIVAFVLLQDYNKKQFFERLKQAHSNYQGLLAQLKHYPTNADLKQRTLEAGRFYSRMTRENKGVTLFDEMALMNDINAACAGATHYMHMHPQPPPPPMQYAPPYPATPTQQVASTPEERLRKLKDLHDKNMISDNEYITQRQRILDEM